MIYIIKMSSEKKLEYNKRYIEKNKEKLESKIKCECGVEYMLRGKSQHNKSQKHKMYVLNKKSEEINKNFEIKEEERVEIINDIKKEITAKISNDIKKQIEKDIDKVKKNINEIIDKVIDKVIDDKMLKNI
jgi:hypothetical protein